MMKKDRGSTLIEVLLAIVILGVAGITIINAMNSGNAAARKNQGKSAAFYQLASATEAYGAAAYIDCSATVKDPYRAAGKIPAGALPSRVSVSIETLTKAGSNWAWKNCGDNSSWGTYDDAKTQRITLQYKLQSNACDAITQTKTTLCMTRSLLKSDSNKTSQFGVVGGFRVWPVAPLSLVWNENRNISLRVAGTPSPTDTVVFRVVSASAGLSATANANGVSVTAGGTSGTYSLVVDACDLTLGSCDSTSPTFNPLAIASSTTISISVFEPLSLTSSTVFTGNAGYASTPTQLTYRGGNGQAVTFSTSASPTAFVVTPTGTFNWTATAPASAINGTYNTLVPNVVPVTLTQTGLTPTTVNLSVTLYSPLRLIAPQQPPLPAENVSLNAGSGDVYVLKAVGGNPASAISMSTTSSLFTLSASTLSQGISSSNLALKSATTAIDRYTVPVSLSGAGWPTSVAYSVTTIVQPVVTDPGLIESALGSARSYTLACTCTGGTNVKYVFDSSWTGTGFSLTSAGVLSWPNTIAMGTYSIPITVSVRSPSGLTISSDIRTVNVAIYGPLRLIKPLSDEFLVFNYGSTTAGTLQATGGRPSQVITIASSSTNFTIGTPSLANQITTASIAPRSANLPGVGQMSIPITLSGASATTVNTTANVRIRPVLNTPGTISAMAGFSGEASISSSCSCTGATTTSYSIDSGFSNSAISITTAGIIKWTSSLTAGTYSIPVIVRASNSNGILVESLPTNVTLRISPRLTLVSPTTTQVGGFGGSPTGGFPLSAYGGNGSSASFKVDPSYANASYFTVTTNAAAYNAATLTSVGSISYSATTPIGTYVVPILLFGGGAPSDISGGSVTINVRSALAATATASAACQAFNATTLSAPCTVTITYTNNTGSGAGLKLSSAPTATNTLVWSTSVGSATTALPFPATSGTNTLTLYFSKTSGTSAFCRSTSSGLTNTTGSVTVVVQDPLSAATFTLPAVAIKC